MERSYGHVPSGANRRHRRSVFLWMVSSLPSISYAGEFTIRNWSSVWTLRCKPPSGGKWTSSVGLHKLLGRGETNSLCLLVCRLDRVLRLRNPCFSFGMAVVYRTGRRIERWSRTLGLAYLVLIGSSVPILAWLTADQVVTVEQASCEELDPAVDRLNGMSPSEFRVRCIATQDNSDWPARRKIRNPAARGRGRSPAPCLLCPISTPAT